MNLMKRREFIKLMGAGTTAAAVLTLPGFGCSHVRTKPNIIFILADDLGYGDLGCYGQTKILTPTLDRMAQEGVRFTDCYSGSTVCAPSRSSLMTGQHTGHTRVRGNRSEKTRERIPLLPEDLTIAEILTNAGYTTGVVGKWGIGEAGSTGIPNNKGFDFWYGYLNQTNAHFYYPPFLWKNEQKILLEGNNNNRRGQYAHDLFTEEALNFIDRNKDNPFFLYLAYTIPHAELLVPEDSFAEYLGLFPEVPYAGRPGGYASQENPNAAYAAMITRMDRDIGAILHKLKVLGIDENTIVFFTSDNGPSAEGGQNMEFFNSNGPLRGIKRDLYEGGIRVPMIVRWHGKIKPGTVSSQSWAFWDFLPTAAELAGAEFPGNIDGISMVPVLLGKPQREHDYLYWEFRRRGFHQALRMDKWKAVRHNPDDEIELYNLEDDIGEQHNIAGENKEIVTQAAEIFAKARTESEHWPMAKM